MNSLRQQISRKRLIRDVQIVFLTIVLGTSLGVVGFLAMDLLMGTTR